MMNCFTVKITRFEVHRSKRDSSFVLYGLRKTLSGYSPVRNNFSDLGFETKTYAGGVFSGLRHLANSFWHPISIDAMSAIFRKNMITKSSLLADLQVNSWLSSLNPNLDNISH